eukprot:5852125-Pleurochrysis_carterae.AAC.3
MALTTCRSATDREYEKQVQKVIKKSLNSGRPALKENSRPRASCRATPSSSPERTAHSKRVVYRWTKTENSIFTQTQTERERKGAPK